MTQIIRKRSWPQIKTVRYDLVVNTGRLGSRKEINPHNCAGFWVVYKAHPPAHFGICAGGCNAVDGPTDKQDVDLFFLGPLSIE